MLFFYYDAKEGKEALADIINYDDTNGVKIKVLKEDEVTNKLLDNMINLLYELQKDYEKTIKFL